MLKIEYLKPSSCGEIVAAWAGSITLHAGVILGLHWVAPSLAPVPDGPSTLQVSVIESVQISPPDIHSGETTGSPEPRVVTKSPARTAPLAAPVVRSRVPEIGTVPATAVEARPASRLHSRTALPTQKRRPSVVVARRADPVETDVTVSRRSLAQRAPAQVQRGAETITSAVGLKTRPLESTRTRDKASFSTRDVGTRNASRLFPGESSKTVAAPAPMTVRKSERAASRPLVETRADTSPDVVRAAPGAREVRVLDGGPSHVRAASASTSGAPTQLEEAVTGTRTIQTVRPQSEQRVTRTAPQVASLPLHRRSRVGSTDSISDYGWLARAVHRRIAELKRYPRAARVNQWEGRVVLRAVIREDGQLAALSVRTSSGHNELDEDAMELVRQISPISLMHPLGRPEITMHIPITYTLDR